MDNEIWTPIEKPGSASNNVLWIVELATVLPHSYSGISTANFLLTSKSRMTTVSATVSGTTRGTLWHDMNLPQCSGSCHFPKVYR